MTLDNIHLTNITTAGQNIPFNATLVNQKGGIAPCASKRQLRRLQQAITDVTVTYVILSSDTLNATELQTLIASSPFLGTTIFTPQSTPIASDSNLLVSVMAPIGALMALSLFALAIAIRRHNQIKSPVSDGVSKSKRVTLIDQPMVIKQSPLEFLEERQDFEPQRVRI